MNDILTSAELADILKTETYGADLSTIVGSSGVWWPNNMPPSRVYATSEDSAHES